MNEEKQWGQELLKLLDSLDMSDWTALGMEDPVEWVKAVRQQNLSRLEAYWSGTDLSLPYTIELTSDEDGVYLHRYRF